MSNIPKLFIQALGQDLINRTKLDEKEKERIRAQARQELANELTEQYPVLIHQCPECSKYVAGDCENWPPYNTSYCNNCGQAWCPKCTADYFIQTPCECRHCGNWHCTECNCLL